MLINKIWNVVVEHYREKKAVKNYHKIYREFPGEKTRRSIKKLSDIPLIASILDINETEFKKRLNINRTKRSI